MTTTAFSSDLSRLVPILAEHPVGVEPLQPQTVGVYMIELHIRSSDLRAMSAINNALRLAFEAASSVAGDEGQPAVALELVWGGSGSWREVVMLNPRTSLGREQLNYIVGLALQALACIEGVPPALAFALNAVFAGSMLVVTSYRSDLPRMEADTVDAEALRGVEVMGTLYPPRNSLAATVGSISPVESR